MPNYSRTETPFLVKTSTLMYNCGQEKEIEMGKYIEPQGTETRKTCKQPGCDIKMVKPGHVYCHAHYVEFRAWLGKTDRKLGSLLEAEYKEGTIFRPGTREYAESHGEDWWPEPDGA